MSTAIGSSTGRSSLSSLSFRLALPSWDSSSGSAHHIFPSIPSSHCSQTIVDLVN